MKKFSRMPKSESGGLGGGSSSGSGCGGGSNFIGKVFAIGRHQVTVDELIAEVLRPTLQTSVCFMLYSPNLPLA
ncbi:BMP-2-inducible protein kinase isoform X1 [Tachysurus ichikawai]